MSNEIFPTLPGLAWSVVKSPIWKTGIQQAVSGKEVRTAYRARPIWKFSLTYEFLRGANGLSEYQTLLAFFNKRMGSFDSFLFWDESDNYVTNQNIGIGDGVTRTFPLLHSMGGWLEPVGYGDVAEFKVGGTVNGNFNYTTNDRDSLTAITAPPYGSVISWTGAFHYRVRFEKDLLDFDQFMKDLWSLKKCDLIGVI